MVVWLYKHATEALNLRAYQSFNLNLFLTTAQIYRNGLVRNDKDFDWFLIQNVCARGNDLNIKFNLFVTFNILGARVWYLCRDKYI